MSCLKTELENVHLISQDFYLQYYFHFSKLFQMVGRINSEKMLCSVESFILCDVCPPTYTTHKLQWVLNKCNTYIQTITSCSFNDEHRWNKNIIILIYATSSIKQRDEKMKEILL